MVALVVAGAALSWQGAVEQQSSRVPETPRADSVHVRRAAESAQRAFEAFRRDRLPVRDGGSGECDARIGRFCYWRGDEADDESPPPEAADVVARRARLVALLDTASSALTGDAWIAGQLTRYLAESGRIDDAIAFARTRCDASRAWCAALAGYAAHVGGRFAAADSEYSVALSAMDDAERCRWLDVGELLDGPLADRLEHMPCDARDSLVRRVLTLGAPLYSVSTTDLLTEHLARYTRARIAEHAGTADGDPWGDDERDLVLRYGWPHWYSRGLPPVDPAARPSITGHDTGMPYQFVPSLNGVDHDGHITADDWSLDDRRARTGYAPAYARTFHGRVPSQIARFRRGDSTLVVATWDARRDTTMIGRPLAAALVVRPDDAPMAVSRIDSTTAVGRLTATAAGDSGVVSIELLAKADRRAARSRVGYVALRGDGLRLSDLLLYAATSGVTPDFASAVDRALAGLEIPLSRSVGVYWETYGLPPRGAPVHFTLTVQQVGVGWLRRTAERLHLADRTTGLRLQWDEVPEQHAGVAARGVRLDLSRLRSGTYTLALTAASGGTSATAEREIVLR